MTPDIDVEAPRFEFKYPNVDVTTNIPKLNIQVKEDSTVYYVVMPSDSQVPDEKLLLDYQNTDTSLVKARGEINLQKNIAQSINMGGLQPQMKYIVYLVLKDQQYNYSAVEWREFTTK